MTHTPSDGLRQASDKKLLKVGIKKTVTAPHSLTAEMEPHFWKAASTVIISFLPQISNVWKMANVKLKM